VERDFFPDLPKLQAKLDWLQAVRSGDVEAIRAAQLQFAAAAARSARQMDDSSSGGSSSTSNATTPRSVQGRRSNYGPPRSGLSTPRSWTTSEAGTPRGATIATPMGLDMDLAEAAQRLQDEELRGSIPAAAASQGLDRFLATHTSEDNASFQAILEQDNARRAIKAQALVASTGALEPNPSALGDEVLAGTKSSGDNGPLRVTDGYGTSGQPTAGLIGWTYDPTNMLYYSPEGLALSEKEKQAQVQGAPKQVVSNNTRFHGNPFSSRSRREDDTLGILGMNVPNSSHTTPLGEPPEAVGPSESPFGFVATPSPCPGVDASPFMTWGEVEGTPQRLAELEDTITPTDIGGTSDGPHFRVHEQTLREKKQRELAQTAEKRLRQRSQLVSKQHRSTALSGGVRREPALKLGGHGSETPLSPAAQKLVRKALGKRPQAPDYHGSSMPRKKSSLGGWDDLRSSYMTPPRRTHKQGSGRSTPGSLTSPASTPAQH